MTQTVIRPNQNRPAYATFTRPAPKLPWVLVGVFAFIAIATLVAQPVPVQAPEPPPVVETQISTEYPGGGLGLGPTVWRDQYGNISAVMDAVRPYNYETVTCILAVDGAIVEATGTDGNPAVCVWVRDGSTS